MHALFVMGYIALMIVIGLHFSRRKVHNDSDFIVAGRSLSTMVLTATLLATFVGSGSIVGGASFVFQYGPGAAIFFFAGTPIAALVVYFLLAAKMRRSEATTIPGLIEVRFGSTARTLASLIILLAYVGIVSYQFTGAGQALNLAFGLPVWQGVLISAAIMIGLATMGGLVSVAYTDYMSAVIIFGSMLLAVPLVLMPLGGLERLYTSLPQMQQTLLGGLSPWQALSYFLPLFLLILGDQNLFQRFAAARDPATARKAAMGLVIASIACTSLITLLVCATRVLYPDITPSTAMMTLAQQGLPTVVGGLLLASIVALLLTTGNSYLLSASASLTQDILGGLFRIRIAPHRALLANRLTVVALGVLAWVLGAFFPSVLAMQMYSYGMYGAAITPVFLAALLWPRATPAGALAAMTVGGAVTLVWEIALGKPMGWNSVLVAMPLATLTMVAVSLIKRPSHSAGAFTTGNGESSLD
ncbi:sodium:solute symporter family protein [Kushneria marisflavi]|uniref:Sodium:proline symporter n=1 Tax=Kushneria marisflavi TaxID=157779 RepID=A0A240UP96_9GAMM|nr:sodium:solute symporter family protein [Kushneria marisflavi]ART62893.1 sodium:proline symporter [Kushneria marisflavi]RKD84887.1 SSS family solute:Na+ symporter [Kushneria marisflavi]